jgi:hypothetical protein
MNKNYYPLTVENNYISIGERLNGDVESFKVKDGVIYAEVYEDYDSYEEEVPDLVDTINNLNNGEYRDESI